MAHDKQLFLKINHDLPIPINVQLKEQIKWLIVKEILQQGDTLPPVNQLADQLQVNRNTINSVYSQLRDEGILVMQKGRGTQVARGDKINDLLQKEALFHFVEESVKKAVEHGFNAKEMSIAFLTYVQLFSDILVKQTRLLFIECHEHDYPFYREQIEKLIGIKVQTFFLGDSKSTIDQVLPQIDVIVTTLNHAEEVKKLVGSKNKLILTIGASADISVLMEIAQLKAGSKVCFVCLGRAGSQWMAKRVEEAGIRHILSYTTNGIEEKESLQESMSEADYVYASSAVYEKLKPLSPQKVHLYPLILEKSSEEILKDYAHTNLN